MTNANADIAHKQLNAYSVQDLDSYVSFFAEDCVVSGLNRPPTETSGAAIKARYAKVFARFAENKAVLKNRIAVGQSVADHELVIGEPGGEQFKIIAVYTFKNGLIARVDFAK